MQPAACSNACSGTGACDPGAAACVAGAAAAPEATHWPREHKHTGQRRQGTHTMRGPALLRAMRAACELTPDWHPNARLQRSRWDARAISPVTALRVANAHASKIKANGQRTPSCYHSASSAPDSGPGQTRSHVQCIHLSRVNVHGETKGQWVTTKPRNSPSRNHDSAAPRQHQLICTGAEPIHPVHGPPKLRATSRCSEIGFTLSPFSRWFLSTCGLFSGTHSGNYTCI